MNRIIYWAVKIREVFLGEGEGGQLSNDSYSIIVVAFYSILARSSKFWRGSFIKTKAEREF